VYTRQIVPDSVFADTDRHSNELLAYASIHNRPANDEGLAFRRLGGNVNESNSQTRTKLDRFDSNPQRRCVHTRAHDRP
jgi:hypothetical protein